MLHDRNNELLERAPWPAPHPLSHECWLAAFSGMHYGPNIGRPGCQATDPEYHEAVQRAKVAHASRIAAQRAREGASKDPLRLPAQAN